MSKLPENDYNDFAPQLRHVNWRVGRVEESLKDEVIERKENDKNIFEKFDKMNQMVIYQLGAAILTLVVVIAMFIIK